MKRAFCKGADPEIFFEDGHEETAKAYCLRCPIRDLCLEWALNRNEFGIWGAMTESERRAVKRGGTRRTCPGCNSKHLYTDGSSEICLECGVSWWSS
jgi:WhiB family transcriptional regulator, redox-sensing transcriptional regulator